MIISRRIRWAGLVARIGGGRNIQGFIAGREGKRPLEDLELDGRIIIRRIFRKLGMGYELD